MNKVILFIVLLLPPSFLRAAPDVSFADLAAGRAAIADDPAYFDQMQPMEMEAKTGQPLPAAKLADQRAECRRRYQAAVRQFSDDEKIAIRSLVALIDPAVRKNYPRFAETPWNFLKVSSNIEAGYPHTRGKHIVLAESVCRWMLGDRARWGRRVPLDKMELLLHEQMHVFQRRTRKYSTRSTWANGASSGPSRLPRARGSSSINCSTPMPSIAPGSFPSCTPTAQSTSGHFSPSTTVPARSGCNRSPRCWPFT